jgi:hypothetical protein
MRYASIIAAGVFAAAIGTAGAAQKDAPADAGKRGPQAKDLKVKPADLAHLARNNGGVFPINRVYDIVDGRKEVKAHGQRDMPVWGLDYSVKAVEQAKPAPDRDLYVRGRILELIDYLYRLQAK